MTSFREMHCIEGFNSVDDLNVVKSSFPPTLCCVLAYVRQRYASVVNGRTCFPAQ